MNIKQIVTGYLKTNGYDGLCKDDCGCKVDDLFPCDCVDTEYCEAGVLVTESDCTECDNGTSFCTGGCIKPGKAKK